MESNQHERSMILDRMMGENRRRTTCKHCLMRLPDHLDECALYKIDPLKVLAWTKQADGQLRKDCMKQRTFKKDQHTASQGGGAKRKAGTRPKPTDSKEMRWCHRCGAVRMSRWDGSQYQCVRCESIDG